MKGTFFLPRYLVWHYTEGLASLFVIWGNFLWFFYNFFSIPFLLKTLFAPFERMQDEYKKGFDPAEYFSTLFINTVMRIVGALARIFIIILGLAFLLVTFTGGIALVIIWLVLPFLSVSFLFFGINGVMQYL